MKTNAEKAVYMRLWRKRHPKLVRAANRRYRAGHRETINAAHRRLRVRSKIASGRVCRSCRRRDDETCWSVLRDLCSSCRKRGTANGFCEACDSAVYLTSGRGARPVRACRCPDGFELRLWDALRWHDGNVIRLLVLAERMSVTMRTLERRRGDLLEILRRFDPDARVDYEKETLGTPAILVFAAAKVAQGLERLALGVA